MKNVTLSIPDEVARWARVWAAEHDTSVSKMLSDLLRERMETAKNYQSAMATFLARAPIELKKGEGYPSRDTLYER